MRPRRRRRHVYHGSPGHFKIVLALVRYRCYLQQNANDDQYPIIKPAPSCFLARVVIFFVSSRVILIRVYTFLFYLNFLKLLESKDSWDNFFYLQLFYL